ncbi:hypothetical protein [Gemmobacter denitrificans]|uniref:Uncharacterized protein n=1 Tax=Gemmobacter denitrificans TaxID=3123040 RepID=A0ABU8BYL9_9RHOB
MPVFNLKPAQLEGIVRVAIDEGQHSSKEKDRFIASESTYRRLLRGKRGDQSEHKFTGLLLGFRRYLRKKGNPERSEKERSAAGKMAALIQDFEAAYSLEEEVETNEKNESVARSGAKIRSSGQFRRLARLFIALLKIDDDSGEQAENFLFPSEAGTFTHYLTYRLSSERGYVQKSFTAIRRPDHESPFPQFGNFYLQGTNNRETWGVCIAFGSQIVFWGTSDNGVAAKVLIIDRSDGKRADGSFVGLLLTKEPGTGPTAASRFMFVPTSITHSQEVHTGRIDFLQFEREYPDILNELKRDITIGRKLLFKKNGRPYNERELVGMVEQALGPKEGWPRDSRKRNINPSDLAEVEVQAAITPPQAKIPSAPQLLLDDGST